MIVRFTSWLIAMATITLIMFTVVTVSKAGSASVLGRHLVYNNSAFDNDDSAANTDDDAAIAPDKTALLPGQTVSYINYSNFTGGINAIIIDIADLPGQPTAGNFIFRTGNDDNVSSWVDAVPPESITVLPAGGINGSDRVTLTWSEQDAVNCKWLQVIIKASPATGLLVEDVFYFGNAIGETGDSALHALVDAADQIAVRNNQRHFANPASIDNPHDFNRDAKVDATEEILARQHMTTFINALKLITAPGPRPIVDAGADQRISPLATLNLDATIIDDGLPSPPAAISTTWSVDTGPAPVSFGDIHAIDTTAVFPVEGNYDTANWTQYDRFHGAASNYNDDDIGKYANQWWGCVPGKDLNTLVIGADVTSGVLWNITIPEDPNDGAVFLRSWGQEATVAKVNSIVSNITGWLHKPAPERDHRIITRFYSEEDRLQVPYARVVLSDDGDNFTHIARMPSTSFSSSATCLYGDDVYLIPTGGIKSPRGIWQLNKPELTGLLRPLAVSPGGSNLMPVTAAGALQDVIAGGSNIVTLVQAAGGQGNHPLTNQPLKAPCVGPVYRVQSDGSHITALKVPITGPGVNVDTGLAAMVFYVNNLGSDGLSLTAELKNNTSYAKYQSYRIMERDQWIKCVAYYDTSWFDEPFAPTLRLINSTTKPRRNDFLVAFEGFYVNQLPAYPIKPVEVGSNIAPSEKVTQPLSIMSDQYSIALELQMPATGVDSYLGDIVNETADASIVFDEENYLQLTADLKKRLLAIQIYNDANISKSILLKNIVINRLDRVRIVFAFNKATGLINAYALSGGADEKGISSGQVYHHFNSQPLELRFGYITQTEITPIEIVQIAVMPDVAIDEVDFNNIFQLAHQNNP